MKTRGHRHTTRELSSARRRRVRVRVRWGCVCRCGTCAVWCVKLTSVNLVNLSGWALHRALALVASFSSPCNGYFRETWGISRLWCIPAVVAYVVCMYRIRARLFAPCNLIHTVIVTLLSKGDGSTMHGTPVQRRRKY